VLNIGGEAVRLSFKSDPPMVVDGTDGSPADEQATIWTVADSERARPRGLRGGPSVGGSRSEYRHEQPGYGIRSDWELLLRRNRGSVLAQRADFGKWFSIEDAIEQRPTVAS